VNGNDFVPKSMAANGYGKGESDDPAPTNHQDTLYVFMSFCLRSESKD